jgi:pimeloyl-ACP methyl ester carboxylesterase
MLVDLVRVTTADGVRLDGALRLPPESLAALRSAAAPLPIDAAILVHGTGGSFYSSTMFEAIADRLLQLGAAVLTINTRGHDGMSTAVTLEGPRRSGAAYEVVDHCRHDLRAWLDFLVERGYGRIGLIGHSLGAVKAIYAQARQAHAAVDRLVAISPPRLSHSHFAASPKGPQFLADVAAAESLQHEGRGESLMDVRFPLPYLVTANGYLDKYGPGERYNILKHLAQIACPTLLIFGEEEVASNVAFAGLPEACKSLLSAEIVVSPQRTASGMSSDTHQIAIVPRADHFYTGRRNELVASLEQWLCISAGK